MIPIAQNHGTNSDNANDWIRMCLFQTFEPGHVSFASRSDHPIGEKSKNGANAADAQCAWLKCIFFFNFSSKRDFGEMMWCAYLISSIWSGSFHCFLNHLIIGVRSFESNTCIQVYVAIWAFLELTIFAALVLTSFEQDSDKAPDRALLLSLSILKRKKLNQDWNLIAAFSIANWC